MAASVGMHSNAGIVRIGKHVCIIRPPSVSSPFERPLVAPQLPPGGRHLIGVFNFTTPAGEAFRTHLVSPVNLPSLATRFTLPRAQLLPPSGPEGVRNSA
jgi:hypothetical protein